MDWEPRYLVRMRGLCEGTWTRLCLEELQGKRAEFDRALARLGFRALGFDGDELFLDVVEAENLYGLDHRLLTSVAVVESSLAPSAVSTKGAVGMLQILPETAQSLWPEFLTTLKKDDPLRGLDPVEHAGNVRLSVLLGAYYLSRLQDDFGGDQTLAIASYNVGPGKLKRAMLEGELIGASYARRIREIQRSFRGS